MGHVPETPERKPLSTVDTFPTGFLKIMDKTPICLVMKHWDVNLGQDVFVKGEGKTKQKQSKLLRAGRFKRQTFGFKNLRS